jgi:hypothetical protein
MLAGSLTGDLSHLRVHHHGWALLASLHDIQRLLGMTCDGLQPNGLGISRCERAARTVKMPTISRAKRSAAWACWTAAIVRGTSLWCDDHSRLCDHFDAKALECGTPTRQLAGRKANHSECRWCVAVTNDHFITEKVMLKLYVTNSGDWNLCQRPVHENGGKRKRRGRQADMRQPTQPFAAYPVLFNQGHTSLSLQMHARVVQLMNLDAIIAG